MLLIGPARKAIFGEAYRDGVKEGLVKWRERAGLRARRAGSRPDCRKTLYYISGVAYRRVR